MAVTKYWRSPGSTVASGALLAGSSHQLCRPSLLHLCPPTRSSCTSNSSGSDLWFSSCRCVANVGICGSMGGHSRQISSVSSGALGRNRSGTVGMNVPGESGMGPAGANAAAQSTRRCTLEPPTPHPAAPAVLRQGWPGSPALEGPALAAWCRRGCLAAPPPAQPRCCRRPGRSMGMCGSEVVLHAGCE